MKRKIFTVLILSLVFFIGTQGLFCQVWRGKGKMKGVVTDMNGKPIAGVKVKLFSLRAQAGLEKKTNAKGEWSATWLRGGDWNIDFDKIGYEPKRMSTLVIEDGAIRELETKLKKMAGIALSKDLMKELDKGNELFKQKKYDEAKIVYQGILKDNPDAYIVHQNIANIYFEKKEYQNAISSYQKVLAQDGKHIGAMVSVGNCYSNMGKTKEAIEIYKKIEINKIDDADVLYNIGIFYFNNGQNKEAIFYLEKILTLDENNADGLFQLGMAYMGESRNQDAMKVLEKYLTIDKDSDRAKQAIEIIKALKQYTE